LDTFLVEQQGGDRELVALLAAKLLR